jgi:hypothetical protein
MEPEGVVNALSKIHEAVLPGTLVIDTQPVSTLPPVESDAGLLGALDMRGWTQTIHAIDRRVERAIRDGLFELVETTYFGVVDEYDDGQELVDVTREWLGTTVNGAFARRMARERGPVRLEQAVRLRVLRAR